jgi:hypothetical protein
MLRKIFLSVLSMLFMYALVMGQDSTKKSNLSVTGSLDAYYRYNFNNAKDQGALNNFTSFTNSQNSFELGMASVKLEHSVGKVGAVLDLGVGKRAQEFSYIEGDANATQNGFFSMAAIKQAYVTYAPSEKVKFTMGKFATHVGYELLDPQLNRNYSMSYLFSYGPFSHTGIKADITPSDHVGFMLGISNPIDMAFANFEKKFFLAQFHAATADGKLSGYLNYVGGKTQADDASNQIDLVLTGAVSDKFSIGYNGSLKSVKPAGGDANSWWGSALYLNADPSSTVGLTLRGEYFDDKKSVAGFGTSFFETTLSVDVKIDQLTIIPEFRLDNAKDPVFTKNSGATAKSSASFLLAAIYSF